MNTPRDDEGPRLAKALKALRKKNGWTLANVSEKTGWSVSALSKIENERMSLSYDKIVRLSEGLGIDIGMLFQADPGSSGGDSSRPFNGSKSRAFGGIRSINLLHSGSSVETPHYSYTYLAADLLQKNFVPIVIEIKTRSIEEFGDFVRHPGDEFSYVLEGELELHTDLYAPLRLKAGESIYFDGEVGHAYLNVGKKPCRILNICTNPSGVKTRSEGDKA